MKPVMTQSGGNNVQLPARSRERFTLCAFGAYNVQSPGRRRENFTLLHGAWCVEQGGGLTVVEPGELAVGERGGELIVGEA